MEAATAQRGQPSVFGRFIRIRNSVLARPAWLISNRSAKMNIRERIDSQFEDWAAKRSLVVDRWIHQDERAAAVRIADDAGDVFEFFAGPDPKDPDWPETKEAFVGVSLSKRAHQKYHALYPDRRRHTFTQLIPIDRVQEGLDAAWSKMEEWVVKAGHLIPKS